MPPLRVHGIEFLKENRADKKPYHPEVPTTFFIKKGWIRYQVDFQEQELRAHNFAFFSTHSVYGILGWSDDLELLILRNTKEYTDQVAFKLNKLKAYRLLLKERRKFFTPSPEAFKAQYRIVQALQFYSSKENAFDPNGYAAYIIENLYLALIYQLAESIDTLQLLSEKQMGRSEQIAFRFIEMVSLHFKEEPEVQFYAEQLMITSKHLANVIKSVTHQTPSAIIRSFIINEAKVLLLSTEKTIKEIAMELNFSDAYAFSHFFKRYTQMSPTAYKNQES